MAKEVIVTSATRGIKPGRSGFQVVMRTRGMRDDLTSAIERLSEYRHIHAQGSGRNPILYAHKVLTTGEGIYSVLIQTVDAGNDFSSRSNKLSHCVALDKTEVAARIKSTPAAVLSDLDGQLVKVWSGVPEERVDAPSVPNSGVKPGLCFMWKNQKGDAGWAAVLAQRALENQPTIIVTNDCSPQNSRLLLALYCEALALLPENKRWLVTFETMITGPTTSLWRGTYAGSPESSTVAPGIELIDLRTKSSLPSKYEASQLVEVARTGVLAVSSSPVPVKKPISPIPKVPSSEATSEQPPPIWSSSTGIATSNPARTPTVERVIYRAKRPEKSFNHLLWIVPLILLLVTIVGITIAVGFSYREEIATYFKSKDKNVDGEVMPMPDGEVKVMPMPDGEVKVMPMPDGEVKVMPMPDGEVKVMPDSEVKVMPDSEVKVMPDSEVKVMPDSEASKGKKSFNKGTFKTDLEKDNQAKKHKPHKENEDTIVLLDFQTTIPNLTVNVFLPSRLPMKMDTKDHSLTVKQSDNNFDLCDDGETYGTIVVTDNPSVIILNWNQEKSAEQRHLYRSVPVLIRLTCEGVGDTEESGGVGIWYDLSRPSMKMKDKNSLKVNKAANANHTPELKLEVKVILNLSTTPDPVSGFSWVVSEEKEFWKVQKNLFYKTFQINKTSFQLEELESKAFNFKEYDKFIKDEKTIKLDDLEKKLKFLPFEKHDLSKDFDKWKRDYKKPENKNTLMVLAGKAWLEELLKSDATMDDRYDKFIESKLREEDDKIEKPMYRDKDKKEKPIPPEDIFEQGKKSIYAREFFQDVLNAFGQNNKENNKDKHKEDGYFMLVKYFVKCLEMNKLIDAPESFPAGEITEEVTYEFTFPSSCFFVGVKDQTLFSWFMNMPMPREVKTSLKINASEQIGKIPLKE